MTELQILPSTVSDNILNIPSMLSHQMTSFVPFVKKTLSKLNFDFLVNNKPKKLYEYLLCLYQHALG